MGSVPSDVQVCTRECVQIRDFLGSLSLRLEFLGRETGNKRAGVGHTAHKPGRSDINAKPRDSSSSIVRFTALRGYGIQDHEDRCTRGLYKIEAGRDGFEIEDSRAAGNQDQVGGLCSIKDSAVGVGGGVEDHESSPRAFGLFDLGEYLRKAARVRRDDRRDF